MDDTRNEVALKTRRLSEGVQVAFSPEEMTGVMTATTPSAAAGKPAAWAMASEAAQAVKATAPEAAMDAADAVASRSSAVAEEAPPLSRPVSSPPAP